MYGEIDPRYLSVKDAARWLGISNSSVRRHLASGKLEGIKLGGRVLVSRDCLESRPTRHRYVDCKARAAYLTRLGRVLRTIEKAKYFNRGRSA